MSYVAGKCMLMTGQAQKEILRESVKNDMTGELDVRGPEGWPPTEKAAVV